MSNNVVIYHNNCADGFGSAYAVHQLYLKGDCELYPANHGESPPDVTNKNVYVVDFSYPRKILLDMKEQSKSLIVIDHHKTAMENLKGLDFCVFDMNHSGAVLTYKTLLDGEVPDLLRYIEDRDLWKFELPNSKIISSAIASYPKTIESWNWLYDQTLDELYTTGSTILRYQTQQIDNTLQHIKLVNFEGYENVPFVNTNHCISETLDRAMEKTNSVIAVGYFFLENSCVFSLRSKKNSGVDVSKIAKSKGGGGHANAAGFKRSGFQIEFNNVT